MTRYREADLGRILPRAVATRQSKVGRDALAGRVIPEMAAVLDVMPDLLGARALRDIVEAVAGAARLGRPVLAMSGGHVVKTGCGPLLIQLMEAGAISALAMNGATAIHDYEMARFGTTSEDVEAELGAGGFGMSAETAAGMNGAAVEAQARGEGLGEALGRVLVDGDVPHADVSLLAQAYRRGIPATVHVALGTDIVHQHASADGAAIGEASLRDFRILAGVLEEFRGGVALNIGSAVILPEVFLKAFSVAANLGADLTGLTTVNLDFIRHYRPGMNVVRRPVQGGRGRGLEVTGHHEIVLPLLTAGVLRALAGQPPAR